MQTFAPRGKIHGPILPQFVLETSISFGAKVMNFNRCIVHLFGGIIAVNLVTFLRGIGATLGGDVQTTIVKIIG